MHSSLTSTQAFQPSSIMTVGLLVDKLQAFRQNAIVSVGVVVGSVIISIITEAANRPQPLAYEPPPPPPPILSPSSPVIDRLPFDVPIVDDLSVEFPTIDPLIVAAGPTRTIQPPPTPTSTAHSIEDVTSNVIPLILTMAATVLAAGVGLTGVDRILYGGSPRAWPPPPGAKGDGSGGGYPDDAQEASWGDEDEEDEDYEDDGEESEEESGEEGGGEEEEDEEEEEEDDDEADGDDGPPPPPPDPPAKIEECPKLPRRTPIWLLVWLVCVLFQFMVGAFLARRLGGFASVFRRMTKGPRAVKFRVATSTPRGPTPRPPQRSARPAPLSRSRPPPPPPPVPVPVPAPPPPPAPTPQWAAPNAPPPPRRVANPIVRDVPVLPAAIRLPALVYRWMADLFFWVAGSVVSAVEVAWRVVSRDWTMDIVALGLMVWLWRLAGRLAGKVAESIFEGHTLIEEAIGRKPARGTPRSSPRSGRYRPADHLPRPPPVPTTPTTPTPGPQRPHTGTVPVHQMWQPAPPGTESPSHDSLDRASLDTQDRDSSGSRNLSRDKSESQVVDILELLTIRRQENPGMVGHPSGHGPGPEPATPRRGIFSRLFNMYLAGPGRSPNGSADWASLETQGRYSYEETWDPNTPSRLTPPSLRSATPGPETSSSRAERIARIAALYVAQTSPTPRNASVDEVSVGGQTHDSHDIESWYMQDPRRAPPPSQESQPQPSSPVRPDIFSMYAPQAGPASPPQGSVDEASVDVQGRSRAAARADTASLELPSDLLREQPPSQINFSHDSAWGESDADGNRSILRGLQRDVRELQARWSPPHTSSPCRPQARWTVGEMYEPRAGPAPVREEGSLEVEGKSGASVEAVEEPLPRPSSRLGFYGGSGSEGEGGDEEPGRADGQERWRDDGERGGHGKLVPQPTPEKGRRHLTPIKRGVYGVLEQQDGPALPSQELAAERSRDVPKRDPYDLMEMASIEMVHELPPNCPPSVYRYFTPSDSKARRREARRDTEEAETSLEPLPSGWAPQCESSPGRRPAARWTVPELYEQRTGPAPQRQQPIEEASLDVQGRSGGSMEVPMTEAASTGNHDRPTSAHRSSTRNGSNGEGDRRTPHRERRRDGEAGTEERGEQLLPATWAPQGESSPRSRPAARRAVSETPRRERQRDGEDGTEERGEHLLPATWAPQRESSPRSRPAARRAVSEMYQPPTRPARPRRGSVDEASLDVEGRGPRESMELLSAEEVEPIVRDRPPSNRRDRDPTSTPGASGGGDERRARRDVEGPGEQPEHPFPATWTPQRESSPRSRRSSDQVPSRERTGRTPAPAPWPAPPQRATTPSVVPTRSGISRGPTSSALPTREAPSKTRPSLRQPTPRRSLTAAGRPEQGTSEPAERQQQAQGSGLAMSRPTRTPSPVASGSGIPRTSGIRRPSTGPTSPAPPPSAQPPPARPTNVAAPRASSSNPRETSPVTRQGPPDNVKATLPSSRGEDPNAENERCVSLPSVSSPSLSKTFEMEGWEQRLLDGSFPSDIGEGSSVWAAPGQRGERRRAREDVPALRLVTSSGFSLDVDVED